MIASDVCKKVPEVDNSPQNGHVLQMFPACGPPNLVSSNETPKCSALLLSRALIFEATKYGGPCLVSRGVHPTFYRNFIHTRSSTAPIWNILLRIRILISKEYYCTKNKRKWLSGWCFMSIWAICPCTLGFTCTLCAVYLSTQSDPHKAGHVLG